jgi:hypothetical protein
MTEYKIKKLAESICNKARTSGADEELKKLDEYFKKEYNIFDSEIFFPPWQIVKHPQQKEIINKMLRFKLKIS